MSFSYNFINDPGTTLASSCTAGATSISVTSSSGYPSGACNFPVVAESELMLVTNITGTTWTVVRGIESTTAASHAGGVAINAVVTALEMVALAASLAQFGTYSGLPSAALGARYTTSDSFYEFIGVAGPAWQALCQGRAVTLPPTASWSWDNQGGSSVSSTFAALFIQFASAANKLRVYYRTAPSTPYTIEAWLKVSTWDGATNATALGNGLAFRYSGGKIIAFTFYPGSDGGVVVNILASSSSFTSQPYIAVPNSGTTKGPSQVSEQTDLYIRIQNDGTNLIFNVSHDGIHWPTTPTFTTSVAGQGGNPDQVGVFSQTDTLTSGSEVTVVSWKAF